MGNLSHLDALEAEAIYIIREVAAECENPVMLYSIGKDSSVMLHLALKAFYPEKPPFPFLHIDTTWKFHEMIEFRDKTAEKYGIKMLVYTNEEGVKAGINPFDHGSAFEQGITIDVAYRYFTTDNRSFIVADTPGHEEYTRNMAVGASFADLAVILIDAGQGVLIQTRRHARICALMGIRYFVFAVNKMDLVDYSEARYQEITAQIRELSEELSLANVKIIPVSATEGDNVTTKSDNMPWYDGEALLPYLEKVDVSDKELEEGFYMPVQRVCRPNHEFRGFQGQIEAGVIRERDFISILPSGEKAHVKSIHVGDRPVEEAYMGQPVTIQLDREVDVSRGCVLTVDSGAKITESVTASILWMDDNKLENGKGFFVKLGTRMIPGEVKKILYSVDVNTGAKKTVETLTKNEIAVCDLEFADRVVADEFRHHKTLGEVILIDRVTNMTSACGVIEKVKEIDHELKQGDEDFRAALKGQTPVTVEFVKGKDGITRELAGKVEKQLAAFGRHTYLYEPVKGEAYENTVRHLNRAGIIVLLLLDDGNEVSEGLKSEPFYFSGWEEEIGTSVERIVDFVKSKSSFSSCIARDRDYI